MQDTVTIWVVTGPKGVKYIEAPTWYLARERYAGATPMDCDAQRYEGECVHEDGYEWKAL